MKNNFVQQSFNVPESLETEKYRLEILTPAVAKLDYDAVMSSKIRLRSVFSKSTEWPRDNMSLEDNIKDLQRHEEEFKLHKAFAYTVLTPTREKCLGCVYIEPCNVTEFDCEVYFWVRDENIYLDNDLYNCISDWLVKCWPFKTIAFPGREISWQKWKSYM
ncbi:MAG: hypothetical protein HOC18_09380 [Candidatus Marinimicrobia bacterium]|nr:hypothetical protein [Candidatus Neomarinimicrobiota bacterium]